MNLDRHGSISTTVNNPTNGVPFGHGVLFNQLQPSALDPTRAYLDQYLPGNACVTFTNNVCTSGRNLSDDYFRTQFPGYGPVTIQGFGANQNIHSLQASVRRNFTKRFSFTGSYTWIKTMSLQGGRSPIFDDKYRNWGPSYPGGTPMWATFTYVYQAPNLSQVLHFKPIRWVTDNWEVSGVTQIKSNIRVAYPVLGTNSYNPFANTNATSLALPNFTGTTGEGARMILVGDPNLPSDQVSFKGGATTQNIGVNGTPGNAIVNNAAFMMPLPCSYTPAANARNGIGMNMECFGNAGPGQLLVLPGTGINNWDMTFTKRFPFKSEARQLLFRAEMYNIFNHTQFLGANIGQSYDLNAYRTNGTLTPTNGNTGRYTSAAGPRIMSLALRFQF